MPERLEELQISPGAIMAAMNNPSIKQEMGRPGTMRPVDGEERRIIISFFKKYGPRIKNVVPDVGLDEMVDEVVATLPGLSRDLRNKTIAAMSVYAT